MPDSSQRGSGSAVRLGQDGRYARLHCPGGDERLVMHRFAGTEAISRLFEFQVDALSQEVDYKLENLLGRSVGVTYGTYGGTERFFNGIVASGEWTGKSRDLYGYRLVLRPWFWLLGRKTNCKIFKNKTIVEIIKEVFAESNFSDYRIEVVYEFKKQEFVVQYGETDLAFVCRLMEEWGIYFYFEHTQDKHVMHLIDSPQMHPKINCASQGSETGEKDLVFRPLEGRSRHEREILTAWRAERQVRTGRVELRDFDYVAPHVSMQAERSGEESYSHSSIEAYDYRGRWTMDGNEGRHLATVRLEAEQALDQRKFGMGDAATLYPGGYVTLRGLGGGDGDYLVVAARHRFTSQDYRSGGGGDEQPYEGSYEFLSNTRNFRAPLATPRPRIFGPQTAFVVTRAGRDSGEEIDVDKQGRIVVNFHWNRGDPNADCSRDVRVAQSWAGKGWGSQFIPRVGMEVVVEFLDGDPDQPLVTGAVYNGDFPYPYEMPKNKTQSGIKTRSTLKGSPDNFNELRFEDKKGQEEVYFRAEKDHNSLIQNIETRTILNKIKTEVGRNFDGKGGGKHDGVSVDREIINGSDQEYIFNGDKRLVLMEGNQESKLVKGDMVTTLVQGDYDLDVTGAVTVTAATSITLQIKGGQTSIVLDTTGITLKGPMININ